MRSIDADALKQDLTKFYDGEVTARELIDAQPTVNGLDWISVKDRMPDKPGYYLVSGGGYVWTCTMLILGNLKGWSNSALRPCIEAWMPFPEPYKEGR